MNQPSTGITLNEYCESTGTQIERNERGAVYVIQERPNWELFRLTDYAVSSACGIVYWLIPRRKDNE